MPGETPTIEEVPPELLDGEGELPLIAADPEADLIGIFVALLIGGAYILLRAIGVKIGRIKVGPFSVDIGRFFVNLGNDISNWIMGEYRQFFEGPTRHSARIARVIDTLAVHTVGAVSHLGDQIAEIVNHRIPATLNTAAATALYDMRQAEAKVTHELDAAARQAAAGLDGDARSRWERAAGEHTTIETNALALLSHGVDTAINFATGAVDHAATSMVNHVTAAFPGAEKATGSVVDQAAGDVANALLHSHAELMSYIDGINRELAGLTRGLPRGASIVSEASSLAAGALSQAKSAIEGAVTDLAEVATGRAATESGGAVEGAAVGAGREIHTAIQNVSDALQTAKRSLGDRITTLSGTLTTDVNDINNTITATAANTLARANGALSAAIVTVNGSIKAAETAAAQGEQAAIKTAADDAHAAATSVTQALGSGLDELIVGLGMAALPATATLPQVFQGVLGAIHTQLAGIRSDVSALAQCTVFACDTPPKDANPEHNFKKMLHDGLDLGLAIALAPVLEQAIRDPRGTSDTFVGGEQALYKIADGAINALLSL